MPTNALLRWSGPVALPSIFASVFPFPTGVGGGYTNLTSPATNWPAPPVLPQGTNRFYVGFSSDNFPGVTFTVPVDGSLTPVTTWAATTRLRSSATAEFLVGLPQAILLNPRSTAGGFQFGLVTLAGHTHTIQARTNLASGSWLDLTNFGGDGTLKQFTFPATNPPARFFRVRTN